MSIIKRFWKYVDKQGPDDCWEWVGAMEAKGYGNFSLKGRSQRSHRVSWAIAHRTWPIPEKGHICHKCDNKSCVNPAHLYLGNNTENQRDASSLTVEDVREIRTLYASEYYTHKEIGIMYGFTKQNIGDICNYKTWKDV